MRILITGICGFIGCAAARGLMARIHGSTVLGMDNLSRPGSEVNRVLLQRQGIRVVHGDTRCASDFEQLPPVDWIIDAAANPSVLAGIDGQVTSRQIVEHNLSGTIHALEFAKTHAAGFILLSTSRVYSVPALLSIPLREDLDTFALDETKSMPNGVSVNGLNEEFSTAAPVSLYGATKLASEVLSLEYGEAFSFPVWINRCGVLAGDGQFGRSAQGIVSYWVRSHCANRPLRFSGFGCRGLQVRDVLHPDDLISLLAKQMTCTVSNGPRLFNIGGGRENCTSIAQLANWCNVRFGPRPVSAGPSPRQFDAPWVVMDSALARNSFGWSPQRRLDEVLAEIAQHAEENPNWLELAGND
jgi:CDP-paratose 2-epimerase